MLKSAQEMNKLAWEAIEVQLVKAKADAENYIKVVVAPIIEHEAKNGALDLILKLPSTIKWPYVKEILVGAGYKVKMFVDNEYRISW